MENNGGIMESKTGEDKKITELRNKILSLLTPQQEAFLKGYTDPKSVTFGNALQSALKAGYSQEYAESITYKMPDWLSENVGKGNLLDKANKNLEMALDGLLDDPEKGSKAIQYKATEFVQKNLNRKDYGDRQEIDLKGELNIATITGMRITKVEDDSNT